MRKVFRSFAGFIVILLVSISMAQAEEKEKKEEKTVLEEITVIGIPYSNPVTPIHTRYGTQHNL
ncbi:MAG: hypothetical protein Q8P40_13705, partial [Nitrospirota bacterium]|nr:hypothetical protein [Nitrospirota bacterium]